MLFFPYAIREFQWKRRCWLGGGGGLPAKNVCTHTWIAFYGSIALFNPVWTSLDISSQLKIVEVRRRH